MYYLLQDDVMDDSYWAEVKDDGRDFIELAYKWCAGIPLSQPPNLVFKVSKTDPRPDNYFTGDDFSLYSSKLVRCLREADVKFETFPAFFEDRKTSKPLDLDYKLFHLLETREVIDHNKSIVKGPFLKTIVLNADVAAQNIPMMRDVERPGLVFVSEMLKLKLEKQSITGFIYTLIEDLK